MTHLFPSMDLDEALRKYRTAGDTIKLTRVDGEDGKPIPYTTRGAWAFADLGYVGFAPGVTIDATDCEIQFAEDAEQNTDGEERPERDLQWPWFGDDFGIIGGTWNLGGHQGKHPGWALSGFRALGDGYIKGARLKGQRGFNKNVLNNPKYTGHVVKESFALTTVAGAYVDLEDCIADEPDVSDPEIVYVSGWYPFSGSVTRCAANYGPAGWFAFSCVERTDFIDCKGDSSFWWYTDTGNGHAVIRNPSGAGYHAIIGCRQSGRREIVVIGGPETLIGHRAVEWSDGADDGFVLLDGVKFNVEYLAAIDAKRGAVIVKDCGDAKWEKVHVTPGSFQPTIV